MPMNASNSGKSLGSSSRKRCGRQPETIKPCSRLLASRSCADCKIASTLSSWAASMNEQVLTMTTSAWAASLVIFMPSFRSEPSISSPSTRFLAQPREISPTRTGCSTGFFFISKTGQNTRALSPRSGIENPKYPKSEFASCRNSTGLLMGVVGGQREQFAGRLAPLVEAWAKVLQRLGVAAVAKTVHAKPAQQTHNHNPAQDAGDAPVQPRKLEHEKIQGSARFLDQRRRFAKFLGLTQFGLQLGHDLRFIEL